ncbi:hypothetical protein B0O99DRAFT_518191 [Bisporella sp. PMI_857]|nr:hypothetical protein B0O99DRAFT_518191 [Bisporella sp. PMI_857]
MVQDQQEVRVTPLFTKAVQKQFPSCFDQYGFFAGDSAILEKMVQGATITENDPRLFLNISAPSSAFICGSQGSGKSHTLSCLLENCLAKSVVSKLENPLAGLLFHYDSFISDVTGTPCEAAYLSSDPNIKVRVLCSPTNLSTIKHIYQRQGLNVTIEELRINQSDLTTQRMLDLMAVNTEDGHMPLYLHSVNRILREMRIIQQETGGTFNYLEFKKEVEACEMTPAQLAPLKQRLDTLESFMPKSQTQAMPKFPSAKKQKPMNRASGNDWTIEPGTLTIVDLSCPCVTSESACALFNMCLSLFLEQKTDTGRVVALDEAHKYMKSTAEANNLTNTLLSSIRLQRHLGARVFISTQEPTISPALLDLCSMTIVHRFSSPAWLQTLKSHLAALDLTQLSDNVTKTSKDVFQEIVKLGVGEALCFAPGAIVDIEQIEEGAVSTKRLGTGYLRIKVRERLTRDGGRSVMAT